MSGMRCNPMKRWIVRICVFLLLGAIVNVAVAWGCVQLHGHIWRDGWVYFVVDEHFWSDCAPSAVADLELTQPPIFADRFGVHIEILMAGDHFRRPAPVAPRFASWKSLSAGWPMK